MTRSWQFALSIAVVCAIGGATDARGQTMPVNASTVPRSVPFSGQALTPTGEAHTGSVVLTFGLYTDQTGGTPLWVEQQQVALDQNGRYSVVLGSQDGLPAEAFNTGAPRWLGVQVDGEKEQPRFMLLSVPYALKAADADTIGGKPLSEFVLNTRLFETVKSSLKEAGYAPRPSDPTVSTVGRIPKFIDTVNNTGDSNIYQDGSNNIGIGTTTPAGPLHVLGSSTYKTFFMQGGHVAGAGFTIFSTASPGRSYTMAATAIGAAGTPGSFVLYDESAGFFRMQISPFGNVGFGVDPSNDNKVHVVAGPVARGVFATTTSGGEALHGVCLTSGVNCWAVAGEGLTGGYAGVFIGRVSVSSSVASSAALDVNASGASSYGLDVTSSQYRALNAHTPNNTWFAGIINGGATGAPGLSVTGFTNITGDLTVTGSKTGFVVDAMQNVDSTALEAGDVVVIVGNSAPVLGEIPVVTVRKATSAYDSSVVGVVDRAVYVPDAATKAAYVAEQDALREMYAARAAEEKRASAAGVKPDYSKISAPELTIKDNDGVLHATADTSIAVGGYVNVVTLGSYKMIKVDASFGAIHAGDLLTTSTNPGYAMKVADKVAAIGGIIGKALGTLETGTGTIPVIVMPK